MKPLGCLRVLLCKLFVKTFEKVRFLFKNGHARRVMIFLKNGGGHGIMVTFKREEEVLKDFSFSNYE